MSESIWLEVATGGRLTLPDPDPREIEIESIAQSLSRTCRFRGHCVQWYSVAEHSVHVSMVCERIARQFEYTVAVQRKAGLHGLLHDVSEAYLCDLSAPAKTLLADYRKLEQQVQLVVCRKWNLEYPGGKYWDWVHLADLGMLRHEAEQNMPSQGRHWCWDGFPSIEPVKLQFLGIEPARAWFLERFHDLTESSDH